eukprot:TRINITY_DN10691_c0_g1_i1.p1 TRINITY_DN10691_c0_g1~~TRINITY_DN10691_c0_g1_i1.p1  ORF type:complete len:433 (-),score=75.36 TRINITY_DN10691_c0_g1_i1:194-1492(-)
MRWKYPDNNSWKKSKKNIWVTSKNVWGIECNIEFTANNNNYTFTFMRDPNYNWYLNKFAHSPVSKYTSNSTLSVDFDSNLIVGNHLHHTRKNQELNVQNSSMISVMSFNIWNLNPPYIERINKIVQLIKKHSPDIIGFQEVRISNIEYPGRGEGFGNRVGSQGEDLLKHLRDAGVIEGGYQYVFQPSHVDYPLGSSYDSNYVTMEGVMILSKFPIIRSEYFHLSRNFSDPVDAHQRLCLGAQVLLPDGTSIAVFSTHFSLSSTARQRNIVELADFAKNQFKAPHIIVGDFNTEPGTPEMLYLLHRHHENPNWGGIRPHYDDALEKYLFNLHIINSSSTDLDIDAATQDYWTFSTLTGSSDRKKRIDFIFFKDDNNINSSSNNTSTNLALQEFKVLDDGDNNKDDIHNNKNNKPSSDHRAILAIFELSCSKHK